MNQIKRIKILAPANLSVATAGRMVAVTIGVVRVLIGKKDIRLMPHSRIEWVVAPKECWVHDC